MTNSSDDPSDNTIILAFMLTLGAGLATTIGSTSACFSVLQNKTLLSGGLAVSAGVMIYVSFAEIFCVKSVDAFTETIGEQYAMPMATLCFFIGIFVCWLLNFMVHHLFGHHHSHDIDFPEKSGINNLDSLVTTERIRESNNSTQSGEDELAVSIGSVKRQTQVDHVEMSSRVDVVTDEESGSDGGGGGGGADNHTKKDKHLHKTGLMTALAIAIHNFPEGLATFVATLDDPSVGIAIATAIAIHNIPEGVCVALPMYYASGSRWKGFWYSFFSGITEPIGATAGYFLLRAVFSDTVYGVLFGVVAGMMVYISFAELMPTATKYQDPQRPWIVPLCVFCGMMVMAVSLILFVL